MTIDEIRAMVETARGLERRGNEIARSGYNAALACDMLNDADLIRSVIRAGLAVGEPPTPQYLLDEYEDGRSKGYGEGYKYGYSYGYQRGKNWDNPGWGGLGGDGPVKHKEFIRMLLEDAGIPIPKELNDNCG